MSKEETVLIAQMLKDLKNDLNVFKEENYEQHRNIIERQDKTNSSIAKLKKSQLFLRGVLIGIIIILFLLGFLPPRIWELLKAIF